MDTLLHLLAGGILRANMIIIIIIMIITTIITITITIIIITIGDDGSSQYLSGTFFPLLATTGAPSMAQMRELPVCLRCTATTTT